MILLDKAYYCSEKSIWLTKYGNVCGCKMPTEI